MSGLKSSFSKKDVYECGQTHPSVCDIVSKANTYKGIIHANLYVYKNIYMHTYIIYINKQFT